MSGDRPVPTGRLGRAARAALAGARARAGGAPELAERLGELRALGTKLGQLLGYVDGLAPPGAGAGWEQALATLYATNPTSAPAQIRASVETALGAPLDRLYAAWEDTPVASGSLGQVHRARLPDGRAVAVKVQHPGVALALRADLDNLALLGRAAGLLAGGAVNTRAPLEELRARLLEELDYRAEAQNQGRFRALHAEDPLLVVPEVVPTHSGPTVLTSAWAEGLGLDRAAARPEAERALWCRSLWRAVHRATLQAGLFNADPHPGNFLFGEGGRVVCLDFGCVQRLSEAQRLHDQAAHRAAAQRDDAAFREAGRGLLQLRGGLHEERSLGQLRAMFEPVFASPFRITRPWAAGLLRRMRALSDQARRSPEPVPPLPPGALLMNRLQLGFYSVLARLDAEVDYAAEERPLLTDP